MPCATHPEVVSGLNTCARCGKEFCGDCIINLRGQPVCGACKQEQVQDIRSNVSSTIDFATRGARLGAVIVDGLLIGVFAGIVGAVLGGTGAVTRSNAFTAQILQQLFFAGVYIVYEGTMLAARGQTLGKMAAKIKVVRPDMTPLSTGQAWGRAASRSLLAITQILGLVDILMIFSARRLTLHDRMAKTVVVKAGT